MAAAVIFSVFCATSCGDDSAPTPSGNVTSEGDNPTSTRSDNVTSGENHSKAYTDLKKTIDTYTDELLDCNNLDDLRAVHGDFKAEIRALKKVYGEDLEKAVSQSEKEELEEASERLDKIFNDKYDRFEEGE